MFEMTVLQRRPARRFLWALLICGILPARAGAYVMPAEQIIEFTAMNFAAIRTLQITQTIELPGAPEQQPLRLKEILRLRAPDAQWVEPLALSPSPETRDGTPQSTVYPPGLEESVAQQTRWDRRFYLALMARRPEDLQALLERLGVALDSVAFTRFEGRIAYRIGSQAQTAPKFLVDKERFLPILLQYDAVAAEPGRIVTVVFENYREAEAGAFPYRIRYHFGGHIRAVYRASDLLINAPLSGGFTPIPLDGPPPPGWRPTTASQSPGSSPGTAPPSGSGRSQEQRLEDVIRALKEKYR